MGMKRMINRPKLIPLYDIVKLYFSEYPSIKFSKIMKIMKKFKKELEKYIDIYLPSWIKGKAEELATQTLNFVKKNKYLLSLEKKSFNYKEYYNILKFKTALHNLNLLSSEMNKIKSTESKAINEQIPKIIGIIGLSILLLWGSYTDKYFCGFINIFLVIAIIFLIIRINDVKKNKNGD